MSRKKLVLAVSKQMDKNKKEGRNENVLIRMSGTARDYMGFHDDKVELWLADSSGEDRLNKSILLTVFHAFKGDLNALKKDIKANKVLEEKYKQTGFVTTRTFNKICGNNKKMSDNIWISNDIYDTVMGTDPEFLLFKKDGNREVVSALSVLPHVGEMGCDGAMAEIRPKPEVSIDKLVENMLAIFKANVSKAKIKNLQWVATCYHEDEHRGYPVGGHVHVGNPKQLVSQTDSVKNKFYRVMNKIIDEYITIALVKLDGPTGGKRRKKEKMYSGYGGFGDFRTNHGRLEHRAMSGIWLVHPTIAKVVLGATKAVIDESFRFITENQFKSNYILPGSLTKSNLYNDSFNKWDEIPFARDMGCVMESAAIRKILLASDEKYMTQARVKELHNKFKNLSTYANNRRYIDAFCAILRVKSSDIAKMDRDIKNNWINKKEFIIDV